MQDTHQTESLFQFCTDIYENILHPIIMMILIDSRLVNEFQCIITTTTKQKCDGGGGGLNIDKLFTIIMIKEMLKCF